MDRTGEGDGFCVSFRWCSTSDDAQLRGRTFLLLPRPRFFFFFRFLNFWFTRPRPVPFERTTYIAGLAPHTVSAKTKRQQRNRSCCASLSLALSLCLSASSELTGQSSVSSDTLLWAIEEAWWLGYRSRSGANSSVVGGPTAPADSARTHTHARSPHARTRSPQTPPANLAQQHAAPQQRV